MLPLNFVGLNYIPMILKIKNIFVSFLTHCENTIYKRESNIDFDDSNGYLKYIV